MSDLSKYVELYRQTTEHDTEVLWSKVNIIRTAIEDGADVETLLSECGKESGDKAEQVHKFYTVAMIFDNKALAANYSYWLYQACATIDDRIDVEDIGTYHYAYEWFDEIEKRVTKENGVTIHGMHTPDTLKRKIQRQNRKRRAATAGAKPSKPETVVRNVECTLHNPIEGYFPWTPKPRGTVVTLFFDERLMGEYFREGETVTITITRQPQPVNAEVKVA